MPGKAKMRTPNPAKIMAGKPTEKIFKLGAARVATPNPMLMNSSATMTGKAVSRAPKNNMELQAMTCFMASVLMRLLPMGRLLKLSTTKFKSKAWPPKPTKMSVASTNKNWEITGTLPMLGSIMVAMDKPMALAMDWPATTMAAVTTCSMRPISKPIMSWLQISKSPLGVRGSMTGHSCMG